MKKKTDDELIEETNAIINELVYPKVKLQKAYNYYNGILDADQFKYLEDNFGMGVATQIEFIPLIKKHIDYLVGEFLGMPILPKVSCKDSQTISKITREKELNISQEVYKFLQQRLKNKILEFLQKGKEEALVDTSVQADLDKLVEDIDQNFVSQYEIAAQDVIQYIIQSRDVDLMTKLQQIFKDLLITGYNFYKVSPSDNQNDIKIEVLDPLNTFIERNPESPYVKDSQRVVIRHWLSRHEIKKRYGKLLSKEDLKKLEDTWREQFDSTTTYIRSHGGVHYGGGDAVGDGSTAIPGYPADDGLRFKLIPVYEVQWIETDDNFKMWRYETIRIGEDIYILTGRVEDAIRSISDPNKCTITVNGVYFMNRNREPYSMVLACAGLQDKYNVLHFYRDQLIASSGTTGDIVDISLLPTWLGTSPTEKLQKFQAYKKAGIAPIDTSQEGRLGAGQAALNTIFNGYDDTVKVNAVQAIEVAIQSVENTCSSITGVFRERLNGIQQRDAVTNIQAGANNSFIITKPYYQQMDLITNEMLMDCLNVAKVVYKNGLKGTIILGDKLQKVFTALPKYFACSDQDIHIVSTSDIIRDMETIKQTIPQFIQGGLLDPEIIFEAMDSKSLSDMKYKVKIAMKKKKKENDQIQQLSQQLQEAQQQAQQLQQQLQQAQSQIQGLNAQKLELEKTKIDNENQIAWFKAKYDKTYKESQADNDKKRVEIEYKQLYDGNPYNDKVRQR